MATYQDLELDKFYLVKIKDGEEIKMIQLGMETSNCVLVFEFAHDSDTSYWKKKDESLAEIVEELTEGKIEEYEELILDEFDEFDYEDLEMEDSKKRKKKKKK